ncbi:lytic transglycosylase domain-containing protein [Novosphingobium sp. KACC 22771]|uniref:lytic transglycosylase domain-containing protein n=1 Tax=Novosphingobium sp. KACC 22771 TaxID=3025670 RepID=UPI0023655DBE|nr:lytic transglycosylase domain-containing protein [Novosphingobium sp. KACC 22771]WDF75231.1 lytic transglycosylase domain-containing protein [Novosphingobium sp. KACC 22771]
MTRDVWGAIGALLCAAMILPQPAQAKVRNPDEERIIGSCIHQVSLGQPWLEKTLWGLRDQEAGWIGAEIANSNGSYDLGPLQINTWWAARIATLIGRPEAHVRHWLRFDPCFNAEAARWVFLTALRSTGSYWKAVGAYHSPTTWRQRNYVGSVAGHLSSRFGKTVFGP